MSAPNYGEVFTRRWVVDTLLDLTDYTSARDLARLRLVEPSCGSGAFLGPAVERLLASSAIHGHRPQDLGDAIRAYDLQPEHVRAARALCRALVREHGASAGVARTLANRWVQHADYLLLPETPPADVVIGNPPYIRYDDLAPATARQYRRLWSTMRGRGDIYVGFIERALGSLAPSGRVGFICADRWMRNQYGGALRELIASRFAVEHVWSMHDVDAFESRVSAYPAIIVIGNHRQGPVTVAETTADFTAAGAAALVRADIANQGFSGVGVQAHTLPRWFPGDRLWPTGSLARLALIETLTERFEPLHDPATGTVVSIGVATGADDAFVTTRPDVVEADRLLPLAMTRDLRSGQFDWGGSYLVNPWEADGSLVRLSRHPRLARYLKRHPELRHRFVARRDPDSWYRTIDKVKHDLVDKPKLLLQDMRATINPVLEPGGHYPHHNLYYIVSDKWDLEVLGGLLLSTIGQAFVEAYCVRMRGGTLRFQAQYLRQIRVPQPDSIRAPVADALRRAFRSRDVAAASRAASKAYGIDLAAYELA